MKIMRYRAVDITKIPKEQKDFYRKMKQIYALPDNRTEEAIEENIQKKKAQIVLDAMEPAYKEAVTKSIENNNKIRELQGQYLDDLAKKKTQNSVEMRMRQQNIPKALKRK